MQKNVLVLAAHPDDEVLGCGGTLAKMALAGAVIHVAFLADGISSRSVEGDKRFELEGRRMAARKACEILGVKSVLFGEFPDNQMDTVALLEIVKVIESWINIHLPEIVFTHHFGDVNVDHRRTHEATVVACRPQVGTSVKTLLSYEVPSSTEWQISGAAQVFVPNWFVDISETLDRKLAALEAYESELRPWPHPRSTRGAEYLARWRGATVGTDAAEAFVLGRNML